MRDPAEMSKETPVAPNAGDEDRRLMTPPGDGDAPLDGPLPQSVRPDPDADDAPPESPLWPVPRHDPA